MKYQIESKVYDSGKIEMSKPVKVPNDTKPVYESREKYDYYLDVFPDIQAVQNFIDEHKEETI